MLDCPERSESDMHLFLKNTTAGDLSSYVDKIYGNSKEFLSSSSQPTGHKKIIEDIGIDPSRILYVTHLGQRAKEMTDEVGVESLLVDRTGNRKIRQYYLICFRCAAQLTDVIFVNRRSIEELHN